MINLPTLTDEDLDTLRIGVLTEQERRQRMAAIPAQVAALATAYRDGGGDPDVLLDAITTPALTEN